MSNQKFAIVGLACRLPGNSNSPEEYYENLRNKKDCVVHIPPERFNADYYHALDEGHPARIVSNFGGIMDYFMDFDHKAFKISKKEALVQDVQQKILLETTCQALEDSNINYRGENVGVFIGSTQTGFVKHNIEHPYYQNEYTASGTALSIHANMISYKFDLRGPSFHMDTACSSSGYAMFTACNSLSNHHCYAAVVGGIQIMLDQSIMISFGRLGVLTKDGKCKSFDAEANGFVRSEGCGIAIVKRLEDAIRDGDNMYCILHSTTANADGALAPSLTTPSTESQEVVLRNALRRSNVDPREVFFLEAHCTGTKVGDPAEINGSGGVLGSGRKKGDILRVGSVKGNVGHTECCAYVAGLIKVCMMLRKGMLLPNINFNTPNPKIKFEEYNLRVQVECEEFDPTGAKIVLSSFGFGGANVCSILEGVPKPNHDDLKPPYELPGPYLFYLFGRSKEGLSNRIEQWKKYCESEDPKVKDMERLMYTCNTANQKHYDFMSYGIGPKLSGCNFGDPIRRPDKREKIVFIFSGQGPQNITMGKVLYKRFPVFRNMIDRCDAYYKKISGVSMIQDIGLFGDSPKKGDPKELNLIQNTLPSLIFIQISLFELWTSFGIRPDAVMGHSFGEMCASYACGACSVETILEIAHSRVKIVAEMKALGKMIAIGSSKQDVLGMIEEHKLERVWIAANNSPISVTVGGIPESIIKLDEVCRKRRIFHRVLNIGNAFHTPLISDVVDLAMNILGKAVKGVGKGTIPMFSTTYANKIWTEEFTAQYFWDNIQNCVKFRESIELAMKTYGEDVIFLELAPHPVLSYSMKQCGAKRIVGSINRRFEEMQSFLTNIGLLSSYGYHINWEAFCGGRYNRIENLPVYPFDRQRVFFEHEFYQRSRLVDEREDMPTMLGRLQHTVTETWMNYISDRTYPWLKDHIVQSAVIMPAACYTEMVLECGNTRIVKDLRFPTSMVVPCEVDMEFAIVQTVKGDDGVVRIFSKKEGNKERFILQAFGTPQRDDELPPPVYKPEPIEKLKSRLKYKHFNQKQVYERLEEINLHYGPTFRNIMEIYQGDEESYMVIRTDHLPAENFFIHPSVLDATYHGAIGTIRTVVETFIPESIERMTLYTKNKFPARVHVYVKLIEKTGDHFLGDLSMYDENLNVLMEIIGFRCNILKGKAETPKVHYTYNWQTKEFPMMEFRPLKKDLNPKWKHILDKYDHIDFYILNILKKGMFSINQFEEDEDFSIERQRYFKWAREFLKRKEHLEEMDDIIGMSELPGFEIEAELIQRVGENWLDLQLNKNNEVRSVMFKDDLLDRFYFESISSNPVVEHFCHMFQNLLTDVHKAEPQRVVRILEIGSGTGAMARGVLPMLKNFAGKVEYFYTDISTGFFPDAKKLFKDFPFIRFRALDASRDFNEQGIDNHSIDFIVAYDVIHAIDYLENCLANCQKSLSIGGWFFLLEITNCPSYYDFIFGVFQGWLHFKDFRSTCYISRNEWKALLEKFKFGNIRFLGFEEEVHSVVCARKEGSLDEDPMKDALVFDGTKKDMSPFDLVLEVQKKVNEEGYDNEKKSLDVLVCTENAQTEPIQGELFGVAKTLICEYDTWRIRILDFETDEKNRLSEGRKKEWMRRVMHCPSQFEDLNVIKITEDKGDIITVPRVVKCESPKKELVPGLPFRLVKEDGGKVNEISVSYRQFELPLLKGDEVLVEIKYSAINFKDVLLAMNIIDVNPIIGSDFSGVVMDIGPDVTRVKIGDEVFGLARTTFASHAISYESVLAKKPKNLSHRDACTIPTVFLTTYIALIEKANIKEGDRVLIHSAAGGVGQSAIQLVKWKKGTVYATVGSQKKRRYLKKKYGVEHFADSHSSNWDEEIRNIAPEGEVDVVLNSLAGDNIQKGIDVLGPFGRFLEIGKKDILNNSKIGLRGFLKNVVFYSVHMDEMTNPTKFRHMATPYLVEIAELFEKGILKPYVEKEFSSGEIFEAIKFIQLNKHIGKIVVDMSTPPPVSQILPSQNTFSAQKTYVLSGGLGAVGFELMRYMCNRGANYIALLSRSGRTIKYQDRILNELNSKGKRVVVIKCDCTDPDSTTRMFAGLKEEPYNFPAVGGIIHLAMVLHDAPMKVITKDQYEKVVNVKKLGAKNLIEPFGPNDLEFCVFFSSISSVLCNPEQVNYIAGNNYAESLARQYQKRGYRMHAINLGAVVDVGLIAEQVFLRKVMRSKNIMDDPMTAKQVCWSVRDMIIGDNEVVQHVPSFNFEGITQRFPRVKKYLSHLFEFFEAEEVDEDQKQLSYTSLNEIIKKLLMLEEDVDPEERLTTYGVDSLQSVELASILNDKFDLGGISQMDILSGITINQLLTRKK